MHPVSLLILEDEPAHVEAICRAFESVDPPVEIRVAASLQAYCEQVAKRPPDVVLMDLNLPDGSEQEALSLVSKNDPFPVLVMTSMGNEAVAAAAIIAGALDYEVKSPETLADMPRSVQRVLREWGLLEERKREKEISSRLAAIVESSDDAIIGMDLDGTITSWNTGAGKIFGFTAAEVVGSPILRLIPADRQEEDKTILERIRSGKSVEHMETIRQAKDGRLLHVSITASPIKDASGKTIGISKIARDISDRKAAEEEMRTLRTGIEQSASTVVITDPSGRIEYVNHALEKSTGYTPAEAIGKNPRLFKSGKQDAAFYKNLWGTITSGKIWRGEFHNRRKDGSLFWESATISPVKNDRGEILHFIAIKEDITERKLMEATLASTADRLQLATRAGGVGTWEWDVASSTLIWDDQMYRLYGIPHDQFSGAYDFWRAGLHPDDRRRCDEEIQMALQEKKDFDTQFRIVWPNGEVHNIRALAIVKRNAAGEPLQMIGTNWDITETIRTEDTLKAALERAERAAAAKSEFLGVMSHELRTPLNGVIGFTELLADTPLDEDQKTIVQTISSSGDHLLGIINDILDFSSIERGSLAINSAPLPIAELVESSVVAIRKGAAAKGIGFHSEVAPGVPDHISGDARRIRQILLNLLGNAMKFTARGSVDLRIAPDETGRFLDFSVEDTGIGIPPETLDQLFKPFTQGDSTTSRSFGGTGLGLAISRRLAEAMGGTLTATSIPGKGSTFLFRFPLQSSHPSTDPAGSQGAGQADPARPPSAPVLVVEDEKTSAMLAGKMLESLGYRAEFAADGAQAVKAFLQKKFAAILMDMSMPVMDGLKATKKIREIETGARVPIIALTANVMPGDRERCLAAGMDGFLTKPFKRDDLAAKLAAIA